MTSSTPMPAPGTAHVVTPVRAHLIRRVLGRPLGLVSSIFLVLIGLLAIFGPTLAPHNPNYADINAILTGPGGGHLLGTDSSGHDVFSQLLTATQVSVGAALVAVLTSLIIGGTAGLIAGYYRGWFNTLTEWLTNLAMALPIIVVLLAIRSVVGLSVWTAMFFLGILVAPGTYRLVSSTVVAVREELYVDAARVSGLSDFRIVARHILTVVRAPLIIQSAMGLGMSVAVQAGLEFLGLTDSSSPTWGGMLSNGFTAIYQRPILMLWPALAIGLTCMSLTLLANVTRDVLEGTAPARRPRRRVAPRGGPGGTTARPVPTVAASSDQDLAAASGSTSMVTHPDDEYSARLSTTRLLEVRDLTVGYDQPDGSVTEVVEGINFDIRKGEVHGLVGESGSGKTQTAFSVLGLLPRGGRVTGGTIDYEGIALAGASEQTYNTIRGARIGYIPQEPMTNLDPSFTIGSQLVEPLRVSLGLSKKDAKDKALTLLGRVGILDPERIFRAYPFELSGGMAQRVLIAGAVSSDPDLVIADEPTTALDVTIQAEVLDLLRDLQAERGMAILLVTHDFGVVADLCDRVSVMQQGRLVESGPVRTILKGPAHPYTRLLLDALLDERPARGPLTSAREEARP